MDSLRGRLLIASPVLVDPNFHRTVVLIAEHTEDGAMGLVLNRPAETLVADAVPDLTDLADSGAPVYVGGPVASDSVIVLAEFDEPSLAGVLLDGDLGFVGSGGEDLGAVAGGVRRARVFAGHAGWGPGQLEGELEEESSIVEPAAARGDLQRGPAGAVGGRCCGARAASTRCSRRCRRIRRVDSRPPPHGYGLPHAD